MPRNSQSEYYEPGWCPDCGMLESVCMCATIARVDAFEAENFPEDLDTLPDNEVPLDVA